MSATSPGPRRRRVLHLITRMIVGGAQENTLASVVRVAPDRYESHLWTGPQLGTEGSLLEEATARGVQAVIIPDLVRELSPVRDARVTWDLARRLRRDRFDLIHTHSSKAGIVGRVAAKLAGVPVIVHTAHGWGFHERMSVWRRNVYVGAERALMPITDTLISVSHRTTRIGVDAGIGRAEDYEMIRSGIPLERFRPDPEARKRGRAEWGFAEDDVVIGTVGRLSEQKNPRDFVELARRVRARGLKARFLYVGDGSLRPEIQAQIDEAGLGADVTLAGLRRDVPDQLAAMDVFVLTSLWEGLPRVVPQALATGRPVIAYDISGMREIVLDGQNGWAIEPGALDDLEARVVELVEQPARREELSRRALAEFDASFSEDEMIRALAALYDRLLAGQEV